MDQMYKLTAQDILTSSLSENCSFSGSVLQETPTGSALTPISDLIVSEEPGTVNSQLNVPTFFSASDV